ncbi:MAG: SagB/ThcOx family dehydrogenase [Bryobacteraceae bacterium]
MLPVDDAYTLPRLYHMNSEPWLNLEAYADPANEMLFKTVGAESERIALPGAGASTALGQLIRGRRSVRKFSDEPLELDRLSALLADAYGVTGFITGPDGLAMYKRAVPSAGALYPLEVYALTHRVEGLPDGLYHYHGRDHVLERANGEARIESLGDLLLGQYYLNTANAAIIFTAVFERTLEKYGPRGYRYVLFEAGHAAQNVCLLAAEAGLGSICTGGFYDARLNRFLGLDGKTEAALYVVGIGHRDESADSGVSPEAEGP